MPPLPVLTRRVRASLPFPLDRPECRLYARARHGLWNAARAAGLGPGDEVLMPAYHHGSEVEALVRAGLTCRFYAGRSNLEPDADELESALSPGVRALHLIHYLGFPQDVAPWRRWADAHGLLLLEDAAQSWLATAAGRPVGTLGDVAIFSLYKTFGLPDGGAVIARIPPTPAGGRARLGTLRAARALMPVRVASWLPGLRVRASSVDPSREFALGAPDSPASRATRWLLPRIVSLDAAARRRENFRYLARSLGCLLAEPYAELPDGASPFLFPIRVREKGPLLKRLRRLRIRAVEVWAVPHPTLPVEEFPLACDLRASVVGLPVHQELRPADLNRIVEAVLG